MLPLHHILPYFERIFHTDDLKLNKALADVYRSILYMTAHPLTSLISPGWHAQIQPTARGSGFTEIHINKFTRNHYRINSSNL